jgi:hypothetical protein
MNGEVSPLRFLDSSPVFSTFFSKKKLWRLKVFKGRFLGPKNRTVKKKTTFKKMNGGVSPLRFRYSSPVFSTFKNCSKTPKMTNLHSFSIFGAIFIKPKLRKKRHQSVTMHILIFLKKYYLFFNKKKIKQKLKSPLIFLKFA